MPTWKLTVEYDGSAFVGWQRQANGLSIQEVVEKALSTLHSGDSIKAMASGRTDSGVHARGQVVSFSTTRELRLDSYERGLNTLLPREIAVRAAERVPDAFDARRWARGKRYVYRILTSRFRSPLRDRYTWFVFRQLDLSAMQAGAAHLLGHHDFSAFRAADCDARHPRRELRRLDVTREGEEVVLRVEATAFLKHMVRNLAGTLVDVGIGRRSPASLAALLASRDRTQAGQTAPPHGLCLDEVFYDLAAGQPSAADLDVDDDDE